MNRDISFLDYPADNLNCNMLGTYRTQTVEDIQKDKVV